MVALRGTASREHDGPLAQSVPGSESPDTDPLALLGRVADKVDDDEFQGNGNGSAPLSFTFARGRSARIKSLFQERPPGCKTSKAASRSELLLHREAAANTAALESLARSAEQRNALAFWEAPQAANSEEGGKWWALQMHRRLEEAEKNDAEKRTRRGGEEGRGDDDNAQATSRVLSRGGGGARRRGRDELGPAMDDDESWDEPPCWARGGRRRGAGSRWSGRVRGRGRSRGRSAVSVGVARCKRTRTVPAAGGSCSSFSSSATSPPPVSHDQALDKTWPQTSPYDDFDNEEVYTMADDHLQVPPQTPDAPSQVPMPRHPPPSTTVEEAATGAAAMIAAAAATLQSDGSDEGLGTDARARTDKDLTEEDNGSSGRARGGRAVGVHRGRGATASAALHSEGTDADEAEVDGDCFSDPEAHEKDSGGRTRRGRVTTSGSRPPVALHHVRSGLCVRTSAFIAARAATSSSDEKDETMIARLRRTTTTIVADIDKMATVRAIHAKLLNRPVRQP